MKIELELGVEITVISPISYSFLLFKDMTGEQVDLSHRIPAERYDTFA